jgi:flagellar biosynthesis GTPase FlhF
MRINAYQDMGGPPSQQQRQQQPQQQPQQLPQQQPEVQPQQQQLQQQEEEPLEYEKKEEQEEDLQHQQKEEQQQQQQNQQQHSSSQQSEWRYEQQDAPELPSPSSSSSRSSSIAENGGRDSTVDGSNADYTIGCVTLNSGGQLVPIPAMEAMSVAITRDIPGSGELRNLDVIAIGNLLAMSIIYIELTLQVSKFTNITSLKVY